MKWKYCTKSNTLTQFWGIYDFLFEYNGLKWCFFFNFKKYFPFSYHFVKCKYLSSFQFIALIDYVKNINIKYLTQFKWYQVTVYKTTNSVLLDNVKNIYIRVSWTAWFNLVVTLTSQVK